MNYIKINELAKKKGISIPELSKMVGLAETSLYKTIVNESMKVETLENIARALNVTVYEFFDLPALVEDEFPFIPGDLRKIIEEPLQEEISLLRRENSILMKQLEECRVARDTYKEVVKGYIDQSSGSK